MASAVDRSVIRTRAKQLSGMENSTFITTAEWNFMIDSAAKWLYDRLIQARGQEYFAKLVEVSTTANVGEVDLVSATYAGQGSPTDLTGADFYQLLSVHENSTGDWRTVDPLHREELGDLWNATEASVAGGSWSYPRFKYRLAGEQSDAFINGYRFDVLEILPTPKSVFTLRIYYIPAFAYTVPAEPGETEDGYVLNGVNGWEDAIIWRVVAWALAKEESDASFALSQLALCEQRIDMLASNRDASRPERARVVRQAWRVPERRRFYLWPSRSSARARRATSRKTARATTSRPRSPRSFSRDSCRRSLAASPSRASTSAWGRRASRTPSGGSPSDTSSHGPKERPLRST